MKTVTTRYGEIPVAGAVESFAGGELRSVRPGAGVAIETGLGALVPQHTSDDLRRREVQAISFYLHGGLRHLPLERRTTIPTPAGDIPAEMITFHDNGALSRVFPLNGRLSGYWTEEDESALLKPVELDTPLGRVRARLINAGFHPCGNLRSLTLWPGETLEVPTPAGVLEARIGVCFRPDGSIRSVEPSVPTKVGTAIGQIMAFDPDAVGVTGDDNSLRFDREGGVRALSTTLTTISAVREDGKRMVLEPGSRRSMCSDEVREVVPMRMELDTHGVIIRTGEDVEPVELPFKGHVFFTAPYLNGFGMAEGLSCSC